MPNGYHGSREGWMELEAPFVAADEIFERFAREHDADLVKNTHRGNWPGRSIDWSDPIRRSVWVTLGETDDVYNAGATAAFDRNGKRYFRTEPLAQGVPWSDIHDHLDELLERGFAIAKSWGEDDIPYALDLPQI